MALIRLQDKVPSVYVEDSRDFQLFCRLYDVIINGLKYDIDGIERLINTKECKSTILQLLQTKLGFFTDKHFTDTVIRYILQAFPVLVRRKGTKIAIEETIYLFLKIVGLETSIKVGIINDTPTVEEKLLYGNYITDHSVIIGIESSIRDTTALYEVLRYIIPFGYNLFFYFFVGQEEEYPVYIHEKVQYAYVGNDLNSSIKGSTIPGWQQMNEETGEITYINPTSVKLNTKSYKPEYTKYSSWSDIIGYDRPGIASEVEILASGQTYVQHNPVITTSTKFYNANDRYLGPGGITEAGKLESIPAGACKVSYDYVISTTFEQSEFKDKFARRNIGAINTIEIVPQGEMEGRKKPGTIIPKAGTESIMSIKEVGKEEN